MRSCGAHLQKKRLDQVLVEKGFAPTRSKAADLIGLGAVSVGGVAVLKPGAPVAPDASLSVSLDASPYVSRGGLKLVAALDAFGLEVRGRIALDVGASTGGFTDVLLARGAARVFAVDLGRGQLHAKLRTDPRVVALETTDARSLGPELIPGPVTAIVADVSFISLTQALPAALALAAPGRLARGIDQAAIRGWAGGSGEGGRRARGKRSREGRSAGAGLHRRAARLGGDR
jgi:23S rRNA (cytidine1920-2'-O)/16S rRNA (cytidine1409-2'-O)-methyltransferase